MPDNLLSALIYLQVSGIIAILALIWQGIKGIISIRDTILKLIEVVGVAEPNPTGFHRRITLLEVELEQLREWAIKQGFERRS